MHEVLEGLEPELVWKYFDELRQIPRCSKNEEKAVEYVFKVGTELGLETNKDDIGNVLIRKPATEGYEDHPSVCLQGHVDMVCEKNAEVEFDFSKDPIELQRDGEYLKADGTTLGADNGIGVALCLAIAESKDLKHPPLEMLFTVDEETGLTGASKLTGEFLTSKRMINADSEELGTIYIGCAGGGDSVVKLPLGDKTAAGDLNCLEIKIKGLKGGHSGVDIHLGRANAIKCLARTINNIAAEQNVMVAEIDGGNKRNAIPREASAKILVEDPGKAENIMREVEKQLKDEYEGIEENIVIEHSSVDESEGYSRESSLKLVNLLQALPHGYLAFNPHIPELVDTSTNLATIKIEDNVALMGNSSRSSINSAMNSVRDNIVAAAELAGGIGEKGDSYPSWKPNVNSELLKISQGLYKEMFNNDPEVKAIHAGLETGIIGEHFPGMDMISIGPQIEFPHSPDERVQIESVKTFWEYLVALLAKL
jgi:dipeptidase D